MCVQSHMAMKNARHCAVTMKSRFAGLLLLVVLSICATAVQANQYVPARQPAGFNRQGLCMKTVMCFDTTFVFAAGIYFFPTDSMSPCYVCLFLGGKFCQ